MWQLSLLLLKWRWREVAVGQMIWRSKERRPMIWDHSLRDDQTVPPHLNPTQQSSADCVGRHSCPSMNVVVSTNPTHKPTSNLAIAFASEIYDGVDACDDEEED